MWKSIGACLLTRCAGNLPWLLLCLQELAGGGSGSMRRSDWATVEASPALLLRGLKWVQGAPRDAEGQKEAVERSHQVNTSGHQIRWHEEEHRSRSEDSRTLGWLRQEVSQAGENKSNWLRESRMQLWNQSCWVTGYYLLWNMVIFGLDCEEETKTTR